MLPGVTLAEPVELTVPTVGEIVTDVALLTFHESVVELPLTTLVGFAVKLLIVGTGGGFVTVIVTLPVAGPALLLAVSV